MSQSQLQLFESLDSAARWTVRVSRRARRLSVRVYPGGRVEVVVPPGASPASVQRFVGTHRQWIDRRVEDLSGPGFAHDCRPARIELPAVGRAYDVRYEPGAGALRIHTQHGPTQHAHAAAAEHCLQPAGAQAPGACARDGVLFVRGGVHEDRALASALRRWLSSFALQELGRALHAVAKEGGFEYRRLQVRRQRTRWGSCSASGTISLNMCVMFLSPAVLRYLLVHELCHTRHMNHSARFWALVARYAPDYERLDRELLQGWQRVPGWMFE